MMDTRIPIGDDDNLFCFYGLMVNVSVRMYTRGVRSQYMLLCANFLEMGGMGTNVTKLKLFSCFVLFFFFE